MTTLESYTNTICELSIAKARLKLLTSWKEELFARYFPITSKFREAPTSSNYSDSDGKMLKYINALNEIDSKTGMSLTEEIAYQTKKIKQLNKIIDAMNKNLNKMKGIEFRLYYSIVVEGTTSSDAVKNVAKEYGYAEQTVWKYYYPNIKKEIQKIKEYKK